MYYYYYYCDVVWTLGFLNAFFLLLWPDADYISRGQNLFFSPHLTFHIPHPTHPLAFSLSQFSNFHSLISVFSVLAFSSVFLVFFFWPFFSFSPPPFCSVGKPKANSSVVRGCTFLFLTPPFLFSCFLVFLFSCFGVGFCFSGFQFFQNHCGPVWSHLVFPKTYLPFLQEARPLPQHTKPAPTHEASLPSRRHPLPQYTPPALCQHPGLPFPSSLCLRLPLLPVHSTISRLAASHHHFPSRWSTKNRDIGFFLCLYFTRIPVGYQ